MWRKHIKDVTKDTLGTPMIQHKISYPHRKFTKGLKLFQNVQKLETLPMDTKVDKSVSKPRSD